MADWSMADVAKFDDVLLGILQHLGKIEPFLDAIFYFLARRTDFFRLMHSPTDKLGFPPGVAEKLVLQIFRKHQEKVLKADPIYQKSVNDKKLKRQKAEDIRKAEESARALTKCAPLHVAREEEVKTVFSNVPRPETATSGDGINSSSATQTQNAKLLGVVGDDPNVPYQRAVAAPESRPAKEIEKQRESGWTSLRSDVTENSPASLLENTSEKPDGKRAVSEAASRPSAKSIKDCFNGSVLENYSWSQTLTDVDMRVPVPAFVKKSQDVVVRIQSNFIHVSLKSDPPAGSGFSSKTLVEGQLTFGVKCDDCLWSLLPGECIAISLEKCEQRWWTAVLVGDREIDKQSIDTTTHVHDFDEQTQADIRKVMHDQHMKMQGLPTSEEQKTHEILKKAWDAEGSPFKGTPFDPSKVNIANQGGSFL